MSYQKTVLYFVISAIRHKRIREKMKTVRTNLENLEKYERARILKRAFCANSMRWTGE